MIRQTQADGGLVSFDYFSANEALALGTLEAYGKTAWIGPSETDPEGGFLARPAAYSS